MPAIPRSQDQQRTELSSDAKALAFAEFKALREEIESHNKRIEAAQYTIVVVNAFALSIIYLKVIPTLSVASLGETVTPIAVHVALILLFTNMTFAIKYVLQANHIDKIGAYIARIEQAIYGDGPASLGWERHLVGAGVKKSAGERARRFAVWALLCALSLGVALHQIWLVRIAISEAP